GARPVLGVDEHADAGRRLGGGAGQVQCHHHRAVRQLAETSCGHLVIPPCQPVSIRVSIREPQDAPKHGSAVTRQGVTADHALTWADAVYLPAGATSSSIVEPSFASFRILIFVLVSVILTLPVGFASS